MNPTSPKNKKQIFGINAIKEENVEESSIYIDCSENKNKNINIEEKNNKLRINKLKEERDHSTSVSSNPQISYSKSNISTKEICKKVDKNDDTPINDENLFQITPHFWNENASNKHCIQLKCKDKKGYEDKNKKNKFSRPLTPNLNIIRTSSNQAISKREETNENKLINNIIIKNKETRDNKIIETREDIKDIVENNLNKRMGKGITKTESNAKKRSFSYTKNKILKNSKNICTNASVSENDNNNKQNHQIINYSNNNKLKNSNIYSLNKSNLSSNNKMPFSFNNNRSLLTKNNSNSKNLIQKQTKRKNSSIPSNRNSTNIINTSRKKKKYIRNFSRQKKNEVYSNNGLKPFKSENKIRVVHSKVNNEINNLFKGLSDNIAKDPEVHNKIETLIKDIKDIKKVVLRKTQSNFRPKKQSLVEFKNVDDIC